MPKEVRNQSYLSRHQLGVAAMRMRQKCLLAAGGKVGQPLTNRLLRNPQGVGDVPVNPTQPRQFHGPKTPPLTPIMEVGRFHPSIVSPKYLSGLRSCQ
jgi:hypothetical protein